MGKENLEGIMKKIALIILLVSVIYSLRAGNELVPVNPCAITLWKAPQVALFSSPETDFVQFQTAPAYLFNLSAPTFLKIILGVGIATYVYSQRKAIFLLFTRNAVPQKPKRETPVPTAQPPLVKKTS